MCAAQRRAPAWLAAATSSSGGSRCVGVHGAAVLCPCRHVCRADEVTSSTPQQHAITAGTHLAADGVLVGKQRHGLHLIPLVLHSHCGLHSAARCRRRRGPQLQLHRAGRGAHQPAKQLVLRVTEKMQGIERGCAETGAGARRHLDCAQPPSQPPLLNAAAGGMGARHGACLPS